MSSPPTAALPTHVLEWIDRHGLDRRAAKEMALAWEDAQTWRPDSAPSVQATADAAAREILSTQHAVWQKAINSGHTVGEADAEQVAHIAAIVRKTVSPKAAQEDGK